MLQGKTIAILVEEGFEDSELSEPLKALRGISARVILVGSDTRKLYKGKRGQVAIHANIEANKANSQDFDALIIPGGHAPDKMRLNQPMVELVKKVYLEGKIVAAICHGPQLLISADIVRNKSVTSYPSIAIDLKNAGAKWLDEPVVEDGNLITSRRPADIPEFNKAIIKALSKTKAVIRD